MSAIGLAYVRYQVTSLERVAGFMTDFGLTVAERTPDCLYLRGTSSEPCLYMAELGNQNRFLGAGFKVDSAVTLARLARLDGSSPVTAAEGPGGGSRVRMLMPDGFEIDALHGVSTAVPLVVRNANAFNTASSKLRTNAPVRQEMEAVPVIRLGHFVLHVRDHASAVNWLCDRFDFKASDYLASPGAPEQPIGTFLRVNLHEKMVDHHCLFVLQADVPGVHHCSFEVQDLDHLMAAHDFLLSKKHRLDCGVGRHMLGSQVFDYWRDAFGFRVEHYTDGDVVNDCHLPSIFAGTADQTTQWGARPPTNFFDLPDHETN